MHGQEADHSLEEVPRDDVRDRLPVALEESLGRYDIVCRVPELDLLQIIVEERQDEGEVARLVLVQQEKKSFGRDLPGERVANPELSQH